MLKRMLLLLLVGSVAVLLCGCALLRQLPLPGGVLPEPTDAPICGPCTAPPELPGDLVYLSFSERGSYFKRVQGYEFRAEDGKYTALFWLAHEDDPYPIPVDEAWVDQLTEIVQAYNLILWDGFHGTDSMLLDGDSFSILLAFADGATVQASGYGEFPSGYGAASEKIDTHFMQLLPEEMRAW